MKKILTAILTIALLLCGCAKKEMLWSDVKAEYEKVMDIAKSDADNAETFLEKDYRDAISAIESAYEEIRKGINDKNKDAALAIYKAATTIKAVADRFDSQTAQTLSSFASSAIFMIEAAYDDVDGDFESARSAFEDRLAEVKNLASDEFSSAVRKAKIGWKDVEGRFAELESEALGNLTRYSEVTSYELEELKHDIIDNYELIKEGVTEDSEAVAEKMFTSAVKLKDYVDYIYADEAIAVYNFADRAIKYVEACYGHVDDEAKNIVSEFDNDVAQAKKWTQSTWNIITMHLGKVAG